MTRDVPRPVGGATIERLSGDLLELASGHLPAGESGFQTSVPLPSDSFDVAAGGGYLWVTNADGSLSQINPYTLKAVDVYPLGHPAYGVSYTKNRVWVGVTSR
jgi:streptogramin lyase